MTGSLFSLNLTQDDVEHKFCVSFPDSFIQVHSNHAAFRVISYLLEMSQVNIAEHSQSIVVAQRQHIDSYSKEKTLYPLWSN